MKSIEFIKTAVKDYRVGAVTASSQYAVKRVLREIPFGTKYIVEYGAGDGVITRELLRRMPPDGNLFAIEINESFLSDLKEIADPRLVVLHGDVLSVSGLLLEVGAPRIDTVVSGIPFTFFSPQERRRVVADTYEVIAPKGRFVIYQFSPLLLPLLKEKFSCVHVGFEPRNFPPYFVMRAEK